MASDLCTICTQDEEWHKNNATVHEFSPNGGAGRLNEKQKKNVPLVKGVFAGDPALRMALIDAGIITYDQLAIAEEKLNVAREHGTIAYANPATRPVISQPTSGAPENPRPGD